MLKDIQKAIESLEAHINAEEAHILLMKNDLKILKDEFLHESEIPYDTSLPGSIDELFSQFYICNDRCGLQVRTCHKLQRLGITAEYLYTTSYEKLSLTEGFSDHMIAIIVTVLKHYNIIIDIPNSDIFMSAKERKRIEGVKSLLAIYNTKIIFR
jgi:hypothetical protein